MAFESNNGTQYHPISCGVESISTFPDAPETNNGTTYYRISSNEYILWGQDNTYIHPSANNGTDEYFYECERPTDSDWTLSANNGTAFYYSSAFNCVSFC